MARLEVIEGDITRLDVDAIVNAANEIAAGRRRRRRRDPSRGRPGTAATSAALLHGCDTGDAKITKGYRLMARHVIHTVGPVWHGGNDGEPELLASCYSRCLTIAQQHGLKSIAFPAISTGVYGYPKEPAAEIAVRKVQGTGVDRRGDLLLLRQSDRRSLSGAAPVVLPDRGPRGTAPAP